MGQEKRKLLIVGHGRSGKDTACEYLSKITGLKNAGTTSKYLTKYVAAKLGVSEEEAYACRHESDEMRLLWYHTGNEVRGKGPTTLIREALEYGDITGGVRDLQEIVAARREGLADLVIWIDRDVPVDPTVMFSKREADIIIPNYWSLDEFYERLRRFASFARLM